jgi:hypothetical protein
MPPAREDGPESNERLTASVAVALLVLLPVEGFTLLSLRAMLGLHISLGLALIPIVALKLGSTGWRFLRYYGGDRVYVVKGPPQILMRLLAPLLALTTVSLFGTGVALVVRGPGRGWILLLHKASFIVWVALISVHALVYLPRVLRLVPEEWRPGARSRSRLRRAAVLASLAAALVVGLLTIPAESPWLHWMRIGG